MLEAISQAVKHQLGPPSCNPPKNRSCQEIHHCFPTATSGYYYIHTPNGLTARVYCDMTGASCGSNGGWTGVAYINTALHSCPHGMIRQIKSGLVLCGSNTTGCHSMVFSTLNISCSQVCGRLLGYQKGTPDAFEPYIANNQLRLYDSYVDRVSITYGTITRKHIWTFANGMSLKDLETKSSDFLCPCNNDSNVQPPPFVGNNYS